MRDLDKALADIFAIRSQIAAGTAFRGYGPAAVAATGALALLTALAQHVWLEDPTAQPLVFFATWMVTAAISAGLIWIEMQARSRRHHSGLADAMVYQAIEQFLPVGVAGALLAGAIVTETIFSWPGIGRLTISAISSRDYYLVQGCILMIGLTYVAVNFLTDFFYSLANPRIRQ